MRSPRVMSREVARSLYGAPRSQRVLGLVEAATGRLPRQRVALAANRRAVASSGIERLTARWLAPQAGGDAPTGGIGAGEAPIFLLAAGWRSGSTLLQRLVTSSDRALIWGEPYDPCNLVQRLAESLVPFGLDDWPLPANLVDIGDERSASDLAGEWIATLAPHPRHLVEAHRALLHQLLVVPAQALGFERWGLKEVRFGRTEIEYLRAMYPGGRYVLLVRDPVDAWDSFQRFGLVVHDRWPSRPVATPRQFARHWNRLVTDFEGCAGPDALLVRYEDLVAGPRTVDAVEAFLDLEVDRAVLGVRRNGVAIAEDRPSTTVEAQLVRALTRTGRRSLGYR